MVQTKDGLLDFDGLIGVHEDQLAALAHFGDSGALRFLWDKAVPQAFRVTHKFVERYAWINHEDLAHNVLSEFPKFVSRYQPDRATPWNKFLYFAFYRAGQDWLRKEDPLGVRIPQKKQYPAWRRLSDLADDPFRLEGILLDGLTNLDNKYEPNMNPDTEMAAVHPDHRHLRNHNPNTRPRRKKRCRSS